MKAATPRATRFLRHVAILAAIGLAACVPSEEQRTIEIDGVPRTYVLHVPAHVAPGAPLVIVLHGTGSNGDMDLDVRGWRKKADREGFIVAAPDALTSYDGVEPRRDRTLRDWLRKVVRAVRGRSIARWDGGANDQALIAAVIDDIDRQYAVDRRRIYAAGFSRGGFMAHVLAQNMANRLAAVAVASPNVEPESKKPGRPVSFLFMAGDRDPVIPLEERPRSITDRWRTFNDCPATDRSIQAPANVEIEEWSPCDQNTAVRSVILHGVGHDWPLGTPVDSTDLSWDFFRRFSIADPASGN